jgi:hypothetical protein
MLGMRVLRSQTPDSNTNYARILYKHSQSLRYMSIMLILSTHNQDIRRIPRTKSRSHNTRVLQWRTLSPSVDPYPCIIPAGVLQHDLRTAGFPFVPLVLFLISKLKTICPPSCNLNLATSITWSLSGFCYFHGANSSCMLREEVS